MSRNQHSRFSSAMANGQMGTAYGPNAEGSAEGDILADVNPLSAEVGLEHDGERMGVSAYDQLRGLREDDAGLRMGTAYAPDAEGAAEGDRAFPAREQAVHYLSAMQDEPRLTPLGVSAYDELRGLREDDAGLRIGRTGDAGSGVEGDAEGSAEGLRTQQLGGILVSDGRAGAMIGVSAYDQLGVSAYDQVMRGLREDDSDLRMGTTTQYEEALRGLREDDAGLRIGGLREDDSDLRLRGLREDDSGLRMGGLRESDADLRIRMGVSAYDRLQGLRESDTNLVLLSMAGLREDDAGLKIGGIRTAMMLRGLADAEDMVEEMGRRRAKFYKKMGPMRHIKTAKRMLRGEDDEMGVSAYDERMGVSAYDERMGVSAYDRLGAEDFHPRFDAVMIEGLGVMGNIFDDIFGRTMSYEEYIGKLRVIADQWSRIKPRFDRLAPSAQESIKANMKTAEATYEDYTNTVPAYITEGNAGFIAHSGRPKRVLRWETYLPTVDKLVSQAEVLGTAYTPAQANKDAVTNVQQRIDSTTKPTFIQEAAPYAAGAVGAGALVGLVLAVA